MQLYSLNVTKNLKELNSKREISKHKITININLYISRLSICKLHYQLQRMDREEGEEIQPMEVWDASGGSSAGASSGRTVTVTTAGGELKHGHEKKSRRKGRGFDSGKDDSGRYEGRGGIYDRLGGGDSESTGQHQKSVEGWIIFITNVHEEASEEAILDKFSDFGDVKNIHLNLDRATAYVKGYALIEYEKYDEAKLAVKQMNGKELIGRKVAVDFAFKKR